jgi:hypothetical protein
MGQQYPQVPPTPLAACYVSQGAGAAAAAAAAATAAAEVDEAEDNPELHPLNEALRRARMRLEEATGIRWGWARVGLWGWGWGLGAALTWGG